MLDYYGGLCCVFKYLYKCSVSLTDVSHITGRSLVLCVILGIPLHSSVLLLLVGLWPGILHLFVLYEGVYPGCLNNLPVKLRL